MKFLLIFLLSFLGLSLQTKACIGPPLHAQVLLEKLPEKAIEKDFVAKVEITKASKVLFQAYTEKQYIEAKIIDVIKGDSIRKNIAIKFTPHTCYSGHDVKAGDQYFIAGELDYGIFKTTFTGEWTQMDLDAY